MKITKNHLRKIVQEAIGAPQGDWTGGSPDTRAEIKAALEQRLGPGGEEFAKAVAAAFEAEIYAEHSRPAHRATGGLNASDRARLDAQVDWVEKYVKGLLRDLVDDCKNVTDQAWERFNDF